MCGDSTRWARTHRWSVKALTAPYTPIAIDSFLYNNEQGLAPDEAPHNGDCRIMGEFCWPDGRRFAFTIVDDTDFSSVSNTQPAYEFLCDCGILTTKTIWPLRPYGRGVTGGGTLEDSQYRAWVLRLQRSGFEIALHGVADGSSARAKVEAGLKLFHSLLGHEPGIHTNHCAQRESIYWGAGRLDAPLHQLYDGYRKLRHKRQFEGASTGSAYFWGDLCRMQVRYVRNFVFNDINTLKMDPVMPYYDCRRPYVRRWFSASNGSGPQDFCSLISEANQDRLEEEGGACIVYTHFGQGFYPLPPQFQLLVHRLSRKPGWFVPATQLLDYIGEQRGWCKVGEERATLNRMQWRWAWDRSAQALRKHWPAWTSEDKRSRPESRIAAP